MISVIIPVYNTDKHFISDAVSSVLSQTRKDFELIIVDDGSNEETKQALHELFLQGGIYKIITHPENKGIGAARNSGIKAARYDLIAFLSSDDVWDNDFLKIMMGHFTEGIIFCDYNKLLSSGGVIKTPNNFNYDEPHKFNKDFFSKQVMNHVRNHTIQVNYSCLLGEKKYFEGENSFWEGVKYGEDLYHLVKICCKSTFTYLPQSLVNYREHKNTTTNIQHHHIHENNEKIFKKLKEEGINV